jgi:hypothetical protein
MFGYLTLFTALIISLSAAVYSILGLTAIFAAAYWPIVVLGGSLEVGKIVTTLWLHKYWHRAELQYKLYLCSAVAVLMVLTSMGVFGFLSKAHLDQAVPSGDVQAQVQIFDDKIQTQKDNIKTARAALTQMDTAVDQVMGRSNDEKGADKAVAIRRSQARERTALQNDISKAQAEIVRLQEGRAPIASQARKVEAEVGPIKYIAALIYGDNPDANVLEKAVRWVIILIVAVFDPLAITLLLAATKTFEWERGVDLFNAKNKDQEPAQEESVESWFDRMRKRVRFWDRQPKAANEEIDETQYYVSNLENTEPVIDQPANMSPEEYYRAMGLFDASQALKDPYINDSYTKNSTDPSPPGWMFTEHPHPSAQSNSEPEPKDLFVEDLVMSSEPEIVTQPEPAVVVADGEYIEVNGKRIHHRAFDPRSTDASHAVERHIEKLKNEIPAGPVAGDGNLWINQGDTWVNAGPIEQYDLSELGLQADNVPGGVQGEMRGFGTSFPESADKGDMFLRVDQLPSILYKFNGTRWIEVDKGLSDQYVYDDAYIDHLIDKIDSGEYDPELLSDAERDSIERRLGDNPRSA